HDALPIFRAIESLFIIFRLITHTHTTMTVSDTIATMHKEVRDITLVASSSATAPMTVTSMIKHRIIFKNNSISSPTHSFAFNHLFVQIHIFNVKVHGMVSLLFLAACPMFDASLL